MGKWVVFLVGVVVLAACVYHAPDEDWERNGKVRLNLDWQTRSNYPAAMTYYFYRDGVGCPIVRMGSASGYEGTLPAGQYKVVVCNTDCDNVVLEMDNGYEQACGRVRQVSALKSSAIPIAQPDNFYGTGGELIDVVGEETAVEALYPVSLVKTLDLNMKVTGGGDTEVTEFSGRLSGVSVQIHIPSGTPLFDTPASMVFKPELVAKGVYAYSLNVFGLSDGEEGVDPVALFLSFNLKDGKEVTSYTDITREVRDAFDKSISAHIILDLEVAYDEINGATIIFSGWKESTGEVVI